MSDSDVTTEDSLEQSAGDTEPATQGSVEGESNGASAERSCDTFLDRYATMMDHDNMAKILAEQEHMLTTLEVANEKISSLNQISERNYFTQSEEFGRNIRLLGNMKKELDSVFRRIRSLKSRLAVQYPTAYSVAEKKYRLKEEDESVEDEY